MGRLRTLLQSAVGRLSPVRSPKEPDMLKSEVLRNALVPLVPTEPVSRDEKVRLLAYQRWEEATGGAPVDDEQTRQFWLDAEKDISTESE